MGKKGKAKEPEDPYKDFLRFWVVMDTDNSDVRLPIFLPKAFCVVGDIFKELWRITELNQEYEEEDDDDVGEEEEEGDQTRKFVIFGKRVFVPEKDKMVQCALTFKLDKDLEVEKDLEFKTGDTIIMDSLNRKSFRKLMSFRPGPSWMPYLHPPKPEGEEEAPAEGTEEQ
jgi:hypothetical protein